MYTNGYNNSYYFIILICNVSIRKRLVRLSLFSAAVALDVAIVAAEAIAAATAVVATDTLAITVYAFDFVPVTVFSAAVAVDVAS